MTHTVVIVLIIVGVAAFVEFIVAAIAIRWYVRTSVNARADMVECLEKLEQYASDAHDTREEMKRYSMRIADAVDEIAQMMRADR